MDAYSREHAGDTARLMALVEAETGYRATVGKVTIDTSNVESLGLQIPQQPLPQHVGA